MAIIFRPISSQHTTEFTQNNASERVSSQSRQKWNAKSFSVNVVESVIYLQVIACGSSAAVAAATASAVGAAAVISRAVGTPPLNPGRAPTTFSPCEHSVSFTNTFLAVMLSRSNHVGSRNRYNVFGYISVLYDYPVIGVTRSSC
ncbi:hypothetical protein QTP88_005639 [Uroleucon formosanum]